MPYMWWLTVHQKNKGFQSIFMSYIILSYSMRAPTPFFIFISIFLVHNRFFFQPDMQNLMQVLNVKMETVLRL